MTPIEDLAELLRHAAIGMQTGVMDLKRHDLAGACRTAAAFLDSLSGPAMLASVATAIEAEFFKVEEIGTGRGIVTGDRLAACAIAVIVQIGTNPEPKPDAPEAA